MKLSELPRRDGASGPGALEVVQDVSCPPGKAYVFRDFKMLVHSLDDDIKELFRVPADYPTRWNVLGLTP